MKLKIPSLAIDNHPDTVQSESVHLNAARGALKNIWDQWKKLQEAEAVTTDKKRLARAAAAVVGNAEKTAETALKALQGSYDSLEAKLVAEVTPTKMDYAASEIRAYWKSQRHPFTGLSSLVKSGDRRTLAAVLTAPAYLSGLKDDQHQTLLGLARETWFPEETRTLKDIDHAGGRVMILANTVKNTLTPLIKEWSGEKEEKAFAAFKEGGAA